MNVLDWVAYKIHDAINHPDLNVTIAGINGAVIWLGMEDFLLNFITKIFIACGVGFASAMFGMIYKDLHPHARTYIIKKFKRKPKK